jgi:hypothetical protein
MTSQLVGFPWRGASNFSPNERTNELVLYACVARGLKIDKLQVKINEKLK